MAPPAFYIHDWATWLDLTASAGPAGGTGLYTESPLVWEKLTRSGLAVTPLDDVIPDSIRSDLLGLVERVVDDWEAALDRFPWPGLSGLRVGACLASVLGVLAQNFLYRAWRLNQMLRREDRLIVPFRTVCPANHLSGTDIKDLLSQNDCNYPALLAQVDPADERVRAMPLAPAPENPRSGGASTPSRRNRFLDRGLRLTALAPASLGHWVVTSSSLRGRVMNIIRHRGRQAFYFRANPMASVAALALWRAGWVLRPMPVPAGRDETTLTGGEIEDCRRALLADELRARARTLGMDSALEALATRFINYVAGTWLGRITFLERESPRRLAGEAGCGGRLVLTNDPGDPLGRALVQFWRAAGIKTISFAHGTTWRSQLQLSRRHSWRAEGLAGFALYNEHDRLAHESLPANNGQFTGALGTHLFMKPLSRRLSRFLARRRWRLHPGQRVLQYVPANFALDNTALGPQVRDLAYWRWTKKVLTEVISPTGVTTVLKIYWKEGINRAETDSAVALEVPWPPNVRVEAFPIFSLSRFAADIILVDRPESTLDWALDSGVPLIFLNHRFAPIDPLIGARLAEAVFFIDATRAGWSEGLTEILRLPQVELEARWRAMDPKRREFNRYHALGERRRLADFVRFATDVSCGDNGSRTGAVNGP